MLIYQNAVLLPGHAVSSMQAIRSCHNVVKEPILYPGADAICGLSFVVGSLPYSKRFFSGYSGFPLSSKMNISKFQFDQE